jgi:hypothetical protein
VVLTVQTPGTIRPDFYREVGEAIAAAKAAGVAPEPSQMVGIMNRHGLTPVPPKA